MCDTDDNFVKRWASMENISSNSFLDRMGELEIKRIHHLVEMPDHETKSFEAYMSHDKFMHFQKSLSDLRASDQNIQCQKSFSIHYDMNKYNVTWRNIVPSLSNFIRDKENNSAYNVETESAEKYTDADEIVLDPLKKTNALALLHFQKERKREPTLYRSCSIVLRHVEFFYMFFDGPKYNLSFYPFFGRVIVIKNSNEGKDSPRLGDVVVGVNNHVPDFPVNMNDLKGKLSLAIDNKRKKARIVFARDPVLSFLIEEWVMKGHILSSNPNKRKRS
ncbi:predicted protein [Chaetoceros tenuissimus]|uniref:Uncharacterized protein n=1 Tax=Chaetoceros tenuissimus TaxID=426638 RepID=A0AAD3CQH7_9STRA|nr:predicted protein [Chaetoceros tenuissimus]